MGYPIIRPCLYILHSSSSSSLFDDFSLYHRIESVEISRRWGGGESKAVWRRSFSAESCRGQVAKEEQLVHTGSTILYSVCVCVCVL